MQTLKSSKICFRNLLLNYEKLHISNSFTVHSISTISNANDLLVDFLENQLGFPKAKALTLAAQSPRIKSLEKPQSTILLLKSVGLSDVQIRNVIRVRPCIIFSDVENTLNPKIRFFKEIGFSDLDLTQFLSVHPAVLFCSLQNRLAPSIEVLKTKLLPNDKNNEQLVRVLKRCSWLLNRDPKLFLSHNISFLESCGISGSQLTYLLKVRPRLFISPEKNLKALVNQALDFGFKKNSGMLVYALSTLCCFSVKALRKKIQLLSSYGFSQNETFDMFRRCPSLLATSSAKLIRQLEHYMKILGFDREVIVKRPLILIFSLEDRVIPRYRVLEVLVAKLLLKKDPRPSWFIGMPEKEFLNRFILPFGDDNAEELLVAYKGRRLDSDLCSSEGKKRLTEGCLQSGSPY